jgi:uncharacterized membrane protein
MENRNVKLLNFYIPVALFLIAFVWKLTFIGTRDISIDEPFTIYNAQRSLKEILLLPTHNEPNPPLFMILLHFWIKVFGITPYSVRIIPLIFNATTAVFLYFSGKKIMNYHAGIIASGLFVLSSYQFYFGMETRTYSLLLCATAAAIYYLFSLLEKPDKKHFLLGLIISNIVLIYSHYFGWFVVFMEFITALIYFKNNKALIKVSIALFSTAIAFIPMAITFIKQFLISKDNSWMRPPDSTAYWKEITMFMNSPVVISTILYLFAFGMLFLFIARKPTKFKSEIPVLFIFWIVPYSIMFLVSSKVPMFENRYVMYNSIALYLFIGISIGYLYQTRKLMLIAAGIIVLFVMGIKLQTKKEFIAHREVQQAVNYLKDNTDQDYITIIYPHWADYGFAYYYDLNVFRDINNFEEHLRSRDVYQVWSLDDAINYISKYPNQKIAFFKNGGIGYNDIENYLDSASTRTDSAFFEDCINIFLYTRQDTLNKTN